MEPEEVIVEANPEDATKGSQDGTESLNPEQGAGKAAESGVQDVEYELPGARKVKQADILAWEKSHQNFKRIEADYTKKTQSLAQQRRSFEQAFGRFPEPGELQALGKIFRSYSDPKYQKYIDAILSGKIDELNGQSSNPQNPLEQKIAQLESMISQFTNSYQERQDNEARVQGKKDWESWTSAMKAKGVEITEEIDTAMIPFIRLYKSEESEMTNAEILDKAYEHATIHQSRQKAIKEVLDQSGKAGKTGTIPINPKLPKKPDSEKSYSEIWREGQQ